MVWCCEPVWVGKPVGVARHLRPSRCGPMKVREYNPCPAEDLLCMDTSPLLSSARDLKPLQKPAPNT